MSAPDAGATGPGAARTLPQAPQRYGTIVVVGGGCYGSYYVRQLGRAARAGAIVAERVLVVDRDPACRVARDGWDARPGDDGGVPPLEAATRGAARESDDGASAGAPRDEAIGVPDMPSVDVPRSASGRTPDRASGRASAEDAAVAASLGGPPPEKHVRADPTRAHHPLPALVIRTADWRDFFPAYLGSAARDPASAVTDAIVPSPLMPHLMYEWLLGRARERWPGRTIETRPLPARPATPWERAAPDGTHYVSFATWMCPINCIEPARCPHTRGPRTWSLPPAVRDYAGALAAAGTTVEGPVVLHCAHRAWGVGMFDVADVLAGDATVAAAGASGPAAVLVGTVSHCHGALNLLHLG